MTDVKNIGETLLDVNCFHYLQSSVLDFAWAQHALSTLIVQGKLPGPYRDEVFYGKPDIKKIAVEVEKLDGRWVTDSNPREMSGPPPGRNRTCLFLGNDFAVAVSSTDNAVVACAGTEEKFLSLCDLVGKLVAPDTNGLVHVFQSAGYGIVPQSLGNGSIKLETGNYTPNTVVEFEHVVSDLRSSTPCGRLVIIDGEAGTGKTHFLRALLGEAPKAMFVIIPTVVVSELVTPVFMPALLHTARSHKGPIVLLIEDADDCLNPRTANNMSGISNLLNLSDGILGSLLDLRIVCTTNAKKKDLDEAVVRDGRLCTYVETSKLDEMHARTVYRRLTGRDDHEFHGGTTLASVYKKALGLKTNAVLKRKAGGFLR